LGIEKFTCKCDIFDVIQYNKFKGRYGKLDLRLVFQSRWKYWPLPPWIAEVINTSLYFRT